MISYDGGALVQSRQTVYLDFDGELTAYRGELLTIDGVEVANSNLSAARIAEIVDSLNDMFAARGVVFTSVKPEGSDYSTVFVGKTDAFAAIGNIRGIAETVDEGNLNKKDNAFVLLDATALNGNIVNIIAHEVGHLLGDRHAGEGIAAYLAGGTLAVSAGQTGTNIVLSKAVVPYQYMNLYGIAVMTTINDGGIQYVLSGGVASNTSVHAGGLQYISSGGVASNTEIYSGGVQRIARNGKVDRTIVYSGGLQHIVSACSVYRTTVSSGGILEIAAKGVIMDGYFEIGGSFITNGNTVGFDGARLAFNLFERSSADGVIVDNLANLISLYAHEHIIIASSAQEGGVYKLGGGASSFNSSITLWLYDPGYTHEAGTAILRLGTVATIGARSYTLVKSGSTLSVSITVSPDEVNWPTEWQDRAPTTAKAVGNTGVIGAEYLVSGTVYAARTEEGKSYASIALDTALTDARFFTRVSAGAIGTFRGGDDENRLYMTGGTITTLYAGVGTGAYNYIQIDAGTVGTIYGGGISGATRVDTVISGGTIGTVYGGGANGKTNLMELTITGGTISRVRGGADAGGSVIDAYTNILGGTITGQIVGGGMGDVSGDVELNISIDSAKPTGAYIYGGSIGGNIGRSVLVNITKGVFQGIIVAGSRASGKGSSVSMGLSGVSISISLDISGEGTAHISNPLAIASKVDTAWIFAGQAMDGGSFLGRNTSIKVSSGAAVKYLVGGGAADGAGSFAEVYNAHINVHAATVTGGIWGAGYAYNGGEAEAGDVSITITSDNTGVTSISGDIHTGGIVLGGSGSVMYRTGTVTFTGSGDYLNFSKTVDGAGSGWKQTHLVFKDFTGGFNGNITNFKRVALSGDTSVDIRNAYTDCTELVFDLSERTTEEAFITSMDSIQFGAGTNYIGLVLPTAITGEVYTGLMNVSDLKSIEGVRIGLLNSYNATTFYDTFNLGEVYTGAGFELVVDYESGVLFSLITTT